MDASIATYGLLSHSTISLGMYSSHLSQTKTYLTLSNRWISCRAETLAAAFSTSLAAYLVYGQKFDSSRIGFSLTMAGTSSVYDRIPLVSHETAQQSRLATSYYGSYAISTNLRWKVNNTELSFESLF